MAPPKDEHDFYELDCDDCGSKLKTDEEKLAGSCLACLGYSGSEDADSDDVVAELSF